jgi:DNA-binding MarR family transcriptional regulator
MHPVSFAFKRGHIRAVVAHRELLKELEITPARFDALYIVRWHGGSCFQSDIWRELDLHPSTISRMLKSMEAKGLVARKRNAGQAMDCREVCITLTRKGFDIIVKAIKTFLRADDLRKFYNRMHTEGVEHIKKLVGAVRNIGEWLRDFANHPYSAERPDVAAGERYDEIVEAEVDEQEEIRARFATYTQRRAALTPENDPFRPDYYSRPEHVAMRKNDPAAWAAKIARDANDYPSIID